MIVRASAVAGAFLACLGYSSALQAQNIALNVGTASQLQVLPGATVNIPIEANLTGSAPTNIASLASGITWNTLAGGFAFSALVVGPTGWSFVANTAGAPPAGSISFTTSNNVNLPATSNLAIASFTASVGAIGVERGTRIFLAPTAAANASAQSILTAVRPRILDVCISEGKWGDVNNDNVVNIIDAQQMARNGVLLPVVNPAAMALRGDVTASGGNGDIVDAQQTARFSVILPASARLGTGTFTVPAVATHNLTPNTSQSIAVGATLQITNTPRTAGAVDLTGCAGSTWETSNAAIASVNASGLVTGVAPGGPVTITSRSSVNAGITATIQVTVTGGPVATKLFVATDPSGAVSGAAFTTQPVVHIRDVSDALVTSATNQVTASLTTGTGTLLGTASVNAVNGIATFSGLRIDNAADQKRLTFAATNLTSAQSSLFSVTPGALNSIQVAFSPVSPLALNAASTATANGFDAALNPLGPVASPVWSTDNFRIARVTSAGALQGIGSGSANIIATSGAISGQTSLTVSAAGGNFAITMVNINALTPSVQTAFNNAAARWAQIIRGDLPNYNGATFDASGCQAAGVMPVPTNVPVPIDDVLIYVIVGPIDGPGAILGSAGPCFTLGPSTRPLVGSMRFDDADLANLEASGRLGAVITHEMGHVLGIGTLWTNAGLLLNPATLGPPASGDPTYNGTNAKWAFQNLGTGYGGVIVPVENCVGISGCGGGTINGHWRELVLLRELMTGFVSATGQPNPLSPLTAASLIDQGYLADANQADAAPFFLRTYPATPTAFELLGMVPILELPTPPPVHIDANGRRITPVRPDTTSVRRR